MLLVFSAGLACQPLQALAFVGGLLTLVWIPGQILLRMTALGGQWSRGPRELLGLALAVATMPVLLNPIWHLTNDGRTLILTTASILLLLQEVSFLRSATEHQPRRLFTTPLESLVFTVLIGFVGLACLLTYWPGSWDGPVPAQIHDYIKHHAMLFSLERSTLPLGNPFYATRADGPVYYYHFFYLIPATLRSVAPWISIPFAFGVHAALVAIASIGMFALWARVLFGGSPPALFAALLGSVIGGLDLIPLIAKRMPAITLDAWADTSVRVHNLLTQFVWTPQNMQGLLILLLGTFVLATCRRAGTMAVLLGLLTASLIGSTIWVACAALPAAGLLALDALLRRRGRATVVLLGTGSAVATLFALPSVIGYLRTSATLDKGLTLQWTHQSNALLGQFLPPGFLANVADLPWVLLLELGPLVVLPLLLPRAAWIAVLLNAGARVLLLAGLIAIAAFVTVRSHFTYNDFGQKVILATQAIGVILASGVLQARLSSPQLWNPLGWRVRAGTRFGSRASILIVLLCVTGLPVGALQTPIATVRRWLPLEGSLARLIPANAVRARSESGLLNAARQLPASAIVQADWGPARVELLQLIERQWGVTLLERDTMVFQAGPPEPRLAEIAGLEAVLMTEAPADQMANQLWALGVTHVLVGTAEREAWVALERFDHPGLFREVYRGPDGGLFELLPAGEADGSGQ